MTQSGEILWSPADGWRQKTTVGRFMTWLEQDKGLELESYDALWEWSVTDLEEFWRSIWSFFDVISHNEPTDVLVDRGMPDVEWFPGATLNYAEHVLRWTGDHDAVVAYSESRPKVVLSRDELRRTVARARAGLIGLGVRQGDRVAAYLPNGPEAVIAYLAAASIGAIWSSCSPEFGVRGVVDRFRQIEPKVLLAVTGYRFGGKLVDRVTEVEAVRAALPMLGATVVVPYGLFDDVPDGCLSWDTLLDEPQAPLEFAAVPFGHPLAILYSSGTTGPPKPIVHGHGGVLLEHLKVCGLQHDFGVGDRLFWFSTTGWMMWNVLVSGLLPGSTIVLFDGSPVHPDPMRLWRLAEQERLNHFGVSASFLMSSRRLDLEPGLEFDLSQLRRVGSTGSPLPLDGYEWVYSAVKADVVLASGSGGTDVISGLVGTSPILPIYAGEMSCRLLGCDVDSYDDDGQSLIGEPGELVVKRPMPSMPIAFWGDADGSRLRDSYYSHYPGVWRHGDWITITTRGSCVITGRSDATLNRHGVRIGTAEVYVVVETISGVADSVIVFVEDTEDTTGQLVLVVALAEGRNLDEELKGTIRTELKRQLSPRHVPDRIIDVPAIARTLSGKKLEVPIKRLLSGARGEDIVSRDALANPDAWDALCHAVCPDPARRPGP